MALSSTEHDIELKCTTECPGWPGQCLAQTGGECLGKPPRVFFDPAPLTEEALTDEQLKEIADGLEAEDEVDLKREPKPPDEIRCAVVASYECPWCHQVMLRGTVKIEGLEPDRRLVAYCCYNKECDLNGVHYWPPTIVMRRVGAPEYW